MGVWMNRLKNFGLAIAVSLATITGAQASTVTTSNVEQLTGKVNDFSTVFKYDLSTIGLSSLTGINIVDRGDLGGTLGSSGTGLDIDAVLISTVDCADAACVAGLASAAAFDFDNLSFTAGTILDHDWLFGAAADGSVDPALATLGAFDASTSTMTGWLSFGLDGSLALDLLTSLSLTGGQFFLYVAEAGMTGEFDAERIQFVGEDDVLVNPVPAALPLMLTGLAGFAAARRKKKAKAA